MTTVTIHFGHDSSYNHPAALLLDIACREDKMYRVYVCYVSLDGHSGSKQCTGKVHACAGGLISVHACVSS